MTPRPPAPLPGAPSRSARSFGGVAEAYDRGRPGYPDPSLAWLLGDPVATGPRLDVLEVGAGTGKLTERLVALGHRVHATEPDPAMLDVLARKLPDVRVTQASAEDLPLADANYDVVVAAHCFHWFDPDAALRELARVLVDDGVLSLVWNERDERVPWVRRLGAVLGAPPEGHLGTGSAAALDDAVWFGEVEHRRFSSWQSVDRATLQDLALSRSYVASLDADGRAARLAEVGAFYDEFGRGIDGMRVPYRTECFRTRVVSREGLAPAVEEPADAVEAGEAVSTDADGEAGRRPTEPPLDPPTDDDSGLLLIDFR